MTTDLLKGNVRRLAIAMLDDQNGIGEEAFLELLALIVQVEFGKSFAQDVLDKTILARGRYFLNEDMANMLRNV